MDPPLAAMPVIAFSSARRSRKARAEAPPGARAAATAPARAASSSRRASSSAATIVVPGSASPSSSSARPIVFAVKWPAQVPGPGQAARSRVSSSSRDMRPWRVAPTASQTSWIVAVPPRQAPPRIGPL